jgi:hypothetical protein
MYRHEKFPEWRDSVLHAGTKKPTPPQDTAVQEEWNTEVVEEVPQLIPKTLRKQHASPYSSVLKLLYVQEHPGYRNQSTVALDNEKLLPAGTIIRYRNHRSFKQ